MALPGSTPVRANSEPMWQAAETAAVRIVADGGRGPKAARHHDARRVPATRSPPSCRSAGRSTRSSTCRRSRPRPSAGVDVYRLFETLADDVPLLTAIRPNGETPIEEFEDAGGTRALMKQLEPLLDGSARTVTGQTVAENLAGVTVAGPKVIRDAGRWSGRSGRRPTIVLIRGSLCPDGGIVKLAVADDRRLDFSGPAKVFESAQEALDGVQGGPDRARPGRGAARPRRHRLPRHGHGLRARLRARRRRAYRPGRRGHRRAAVRPGEQGHRGRRGVAGGGGRAARSASSGTATRSASTSRREPPTCRCRRKS